MDVIFEICEEQMEQASFDAMIKFIKQEEFDTESMGFDVSGKEHSSNLAVYKGAFVPTHRYFLDQYRMYNFNIICIVIITVVIFKYIQYHEVHFHVDLPFFIGIIIVEHEKKMRKISLIIEIMVDINHMNYL